MFKDQDPAEDAADTAIFDVCLPVYPGKQFFCKAGMTNSSTCKPQNEGTYGQSYSFYDPGSQ